MSFNINMPLLSIIVPVYNKQAYIDSCIESILKQRFTDFELILVNDGSTDECGSICDRIARQDNRVLVVHQNNQGVSSARNTGLGIAVGKYIGFVDCDDTLEADMYELLIDNAIRHTADISICGTRKIFPHKVEMFYGTGKTKIYDRAGAITALLTKDFSHSANDRIFTAEIARSIKFEGSMYEDTFYNFKALNQANKIVFDDQVKYNYIVRENSVSMTKFSTKYMDTVSFSKQMVQTCEQSLPEILDEAKYFDLITNISLINLIFISGRQKYLAEYKQASENLVDYYQYMFKRAIKLKHRYALKLFKASPVMYEVLMKAYINLANADVARKV
ncbi:glycosyltransferase [Dyadobacter sp. CY326]|uniref:glycosyltransferase n=1 Tax=Dyadobacter sp. CY326 TaxID=2907300 RepID=UPI001F22485A|nr:glycosyltransferase [Dyadobacter sp. CY326]MCE7066593.1 glycosyltransferase [Dyadobacter sp. CY326]